MWTRLGGPCLCLRRRVGIGQLGFGMGMRNKGCARVVDIRVVVSVVWVGLSPMCGMEAVRA